MLKINNKKIGLFLISLVPLGYILKEIFSYLPDLTLVFYIMLYVLSFVVIIMKKQEFYFKKIDSLFYIWVFLMILGVLLTPTPFNGLFKIAKFVFLGLSLIFFSRVFIQDRNDLKNLLRYLLTMSVFTELIILGDFIRNGASVDRYLSFGTVSPIPLGMLGVTTTSLALILYLYKKIGSFRFLLILVPSISTMVISGSKGPIVSLLICIILMLPIVLRRIKFRILFIAGLGLFALSRVPIIKQSLDTLMYRFSNIDNDMSTSIRLDMYYESINLFKENPILGKGTGALPVYPHNFFVEVLAENGILSLIVVVVLLFIFVGQFYIFLRKGTLDYLATCINALFIISFTSLMFSFTYVDHKYMFLSIALLFSYYRLEKPSKELLKREMVFGKRKTKRNRKRFKLAV